MASQYIDLPIVSGGGGAGVSSLNSLTGALNLVGGPSINITPSGSDITIGLSIPGSSTDVMFNNDGTLAANDNFSFDQAAIGGNGQLTVTGKVTTGIVATSKIQDSTGLNAIFVDTATLGNDEGAIFIPWQQCFLMDGGGGPNSICLSWALRTLNVSSTSVLEWSGSNSSSAAYYFDAANSYRLIGDGSGLSGITASISIGSGISGAIENAVLYANNASSLSSSANFLFDENANELLLAASNIALDSSGNLTVFSELQLYFNGTLSGILNPTTNPAENTGYLIWQPQQDSDPVIGLSSASTAGNYVLLGYRDGAGAFLQYGLSFSELRIEAYGGALGSVQATSINDAASPSVVSIDVDNRILIDAGGASSIDWVNRDLFDTGGLISVAYGTAQSFSSGVLSIDWGSRLLYDTTGTNFTVAWANVRLYDPSGVVAVDWGDRWLVNSSGITQVDWQSNQLFDGNDSVSVDWANRLINDIGGTAVLGWGGTSQVLGFFQSVATAPVAQQASTNGAVSAGAVYTATEQAMLNDVYAAMRAYGLLT